MDPSSKQQQQNQQRRKILVLHGNRQTGELLLGRIDKLRRKLRHKASPGPNRNQQHRGKTKQGSHSIESTNKQISQDKDVHSYDFMAPDAPFPWKPTSSDDFNEEDKDDQDSSSMRTWWTREDSTYVGLEESLCMLHNLWTAENKKNKNYPVIFDGILGFSQGARLAHLIAHLHERTRGKLFPNLRFVIMASGYDAPSPTNFCFHSLSQSNNSLRELLLSAGVEEKVLQNLEDNGNIPVSRTKSLHVIGLKDKIIPPDLSRSLLLKYNHPETYEHEGGHFVPMKAKDVDIYLAFIQSKQIEAQGSTRTSPGATVSRERNSESKIEKPHRTVTATTKIEKVRVPHKSKQDANLEQPDEEHSTEHINECEALSMIYPDEFTLLSTKTGNDEEDNVTYLHPIEYTILLHDPTLPQEDDNGHEDASLWPQGRISLKIRYPPSYPDVPPLLSLDHEMNMMQFAPSAEEACLSAANAAAFAEEGMPCAMSCVLAAREFFTEGGLAANLKSQGNASKSVDNDGSNEREGDRGEDFVTKEGGTVLEMSRDSEQIKICDAEGEAIAQSMLNSWWRSEKNESQCAEEPMSNTDDGQVSSSSSTQSHVGGGSGGSWNYTIGLVGKPSAGKSTFFNAATAFARQRDEGGNSDVLIGGAAMAPHPFTTIDPNIGYCYVPAPAGSCPEDYLEPGGELQRMQVGSSHGRDSSGRRLLPVTLKDVAGLVPGAYQGRGRGNKFLDDLTDADVLIHVVDASGTADAEGNRLGEESATHPKEDLAWVRNEIVEWVCTNLERKWDSVSRRGRDKLLEMFSGYKQSQAFVANVLLHVEKFMEEQTDKGYDRASLDSLLHWDAADLRRLVSAFIGVRFPMALALNKCDITTAELFIPEILRAMPLHGAQVAVPLSAIREMKFVRAHVVSAIDKNDDSSGHAGRTEKENTPNDEDTSSESGGPVKVWQCLQSAMSLRRPVLVFPVVDMKTYEPMPGLNNCATRGASLPNARTIKAIQAAGGAAPTTWDHVGCIYRAAEAKKTIAKQLDEREVGVLLRDCIVMKPGSTVGDAFSTLKGLGALRGEFVRAEGAARIGEKSRLLPKQQILDGTNHILKIMTNKKI